MLDLWFGLDASGFDNASLSDSLFNRTKLICIEFEANFHPIFGPILMVTYACLSNTLLLTGESSCNCGLQFILIVVGSSCICKVPLFSCSPCGSNLVVDPFQYLFICQ